MHHVAVAPPVGEVPSYSPEQLTVCFDSRPRPQEMNPVRFGWSPVCESVEGTTQKGKSNGSDRHCVRFLKLFVLCESKIQNQTVSHLSEICESHVSIGGRDYSSHHAPQQNTMFSHTVPPPPPHTQPDDVMQLQCVRACVCVCVCVCVGGGVLVNLSLCGHTFTGMLSWVCVSGYTTSAAL